MKDMAKKRRTKAQKIKAAKRHFRSEIKQSDRAMLTPKEKTVLKQKPKLAQPSEASVAPSSAPGRSNRDLKLSLTIFIGLIASQLLIGLLFRLTTLDTRLYELIQL